MAYWWEAMVGGKRRSGRGILPSIELIFKVEFGEVGLAEGKADASVTTSRLILIGIGV